ncbi:MAG: SDR family NAD(P)-dependent oxidoreductase [Kiritimatiellae bacterium]|nr:SDR family NAD(P)-dependent oxidoreductase [Kiritimatiellia bacterium]
MKSALVTGGTARLGRAISDRLRADGWLVVTSSHRADAGADIVADLAAPISAAKLFSDALRILGGVPPDALVNNAGLFVGEDRAVESVNLEAPKKLTMLMAGRENGRGVVVNILDAAVLSQQSQVSNASPRYMTTKRALYDFTAKSAALFADTLRVNAVAPGPVFAPEGMHEKAAATLLGRPSAADVADAVAFLLSAESTTGCTIPVDGGQHLLEA